MAIKQLLSISIPMVFMVSENKRKKLRAEFHTSKSISPINSPARSIPCHLQDRFKNEIAKLEAVGIIGEHDDPAPWVSNPVIAPHNDSGVHITVDMKRANKAILSTNQALKSKLPVY